MYRVYTLFNISNQNFRMLIFASFRRRVCVIKLGKDFYVEIAIAKRLNTLHMGMFVPLYSKVRRNSINFIFYWDKFLSFS